MHQRCISCARDTAPGTRLFAACKRGRDRVTSETGFLCHACQPESAAAGSQNTVPVSGRYVVVEIGTMQPG